MLPTLRIDSARLDDRTEFSLWRRGDEWLVRVGSTLLMSSRSSASEVALADQALRRIPSPRSVLVGGLGLGFTLRAVLDRLPSRSVVTLCERVPAVVEWNRRYVGELTGHPLADPRTRLVVDDVFACVARTARGFDAILLDVDNGPEPLSLESNRRLYQPAGVRACRQALRPGGVLAVWSATPCARFERLLTTEGFAVEVVRATATKTRGSHHVLFLGRTTHLPPL